MGKHDERHRDERRLDSAPPRASKMGLPIMTTACPSTPLVKSGFDQQPAFLPEDSDNHMSLNDTKVDVRVQRNRNLAQSSIFGLLILLCIGVGLFVFGQKVDPKLFQTAIWLLSWAVISIPFGVMFGHLNLSEQ